MRLFWTQYLAQTREFLKETAMTRELFLFMKRILDETDLAQWLQVVVPVEDFIASLCQMIKSRPILESGPSQDEQDEVLYGIFNLLKVTLRKRIDVRASMPQKDEMLHYLLHECLFHKETNRSLVSKDTNMPPKCKSRNTRYACLSLVRELTIDN